MALQAKVEHAFSTVRGRVGDRELANNELERVLADSNDPAERRAAWEAGKQVGAAVADDVLALVELRNRVARERGYRDWFAFALAAGDIDEAWLERMLGEVEAATREPFLAAKATLDARQGARFGVAAEDLYPWHYGDLFFQRYDGEGEADLGPLLEGTDTVKLTVAAYDGMGLETRHLLERSDLHPRPGKDQHAYCLDVDRAGDIRVLANLAPGEEWLDVLLHEVGHAVYDDHIDRSLPWVLRRPPQPLVTEAVALMLGRLRRDPEFLVEVLGADRAAAEALTGPSREVLRTGQLVFARWCLVVVRFEQAMYADPGRDLVGAWWDLVSSLQGLRRPRPHRPRLGQQDPPGRGPRLLPELPARRAARLPARPGRARPGGRLRRPPGGGRVPGRAGVRPRRHPALARPGRLGHRPPSARRRSWPAWPRDDTASLGAGPGRAGPVRAVGGRLRQPGHLRQAGLRGRAGVVGVLAIRFALAAPLLVGLALAARRSLRLGWPTALRLLALGGVGYAIQATLFFNALTRIPAGTAALLLYLYPALVTAGAVALGRSRLDRATVAGLALSLAGIVLVLGLPGERLDAVGVALGLASACWYTCYILVGEYLLRGVDPLAASAYVSSGAACSFLATAVVVGGRGLPGRRRPRTPPGSPWPSSAPPWPSPPSWPAWPGSGRPGRRSPRRSSRCSPSPSVWPCSAIGSVRQGGRRAGGRRRRRAAATAQRGQGGGRIEPAHGAHAHEGVHPKMTYVITEPCIDVKDKSCIEECPVDCIYEGDRMLYIHPDECVDCGACEPVCPVEAIFYEDDVPAQWKDFTATNAAFFTEGDDPLGSPGGAAKVGPLVRDTEYVANYTPTE